MTDYKLVPVKQCAACGNAQPVSEMKICMHNQMHRYVCDSKCMNDFYNPPKNLRHDAVAPDVQVEPVAYLRKDQLDHVQRMGPMLGEIADSPRADRVPVYAAPQPAEQQPAPDVAGLVEALELASKTLTMACLEGEVTRRIDAALAPYRKGGDES